MNPCCTVRLPVIHDIPIIYKFNNIRDAMDLLENGYLVISLCLRHPTVLHHIILPISRISDMVTNCSTTEETLNLPQNIHYQPERDWKFVDGGQKGYDEAQAVKIMGTKVICTNRVGKNEVMPGLFLHNKQNCWRTGLYQASVCYMSLVWTSTTQWEKYQRDVSVGIHFDCAGPTEWHGISTLKGGYGDECMEDRISKFHLTKARLINDMAIEL
ncbi:hypothetical protein BDR04DRAFT_1117708 [Suillus decipiens]|nr:hypothetical protein BDR04DRAFT_1117708 [Suillus decipiens]